MEIGTTEIQRQITGPEPQGKGGAGGLAVGLIAQPGQRRRGACACARRLDQGAALRLPVGGDVLPGDG